MKIESFEIKPYSIKVRCFDKGRTIEHEYHNNVKSVAKKIINAKSAPDLHDIDQWARPKDDDRRDVCCTDFWSEED